MGGWCGSEWLPSVVLKPEIFLAGLKKSSAKNESVSFWKTKKMKSVSFRCQSMTREVESVRFGTLK
jgi:hypothetical protein